MHDALVALLDRVDTAVPESVGVLEVSQVEGVAGLARDITLRLSYPESVVVVALAGGTGSGKSSLLNAVAGEEIALTGGMRPITSAPLALVPAALAQAMAGYLDDLGIIERVEHEGPPWLCLLDLPDNDSVEVDHRHQVDALLPRVDLVVWVTDPEKYRDASLHHGYIRALASHQSQFIFVLNQIDRIDPADVFVIDEDLVEALIEDGIVEPQVIAIAADPVAGPPIGIDRLLASLERAQGRRMAVYRKALTDLAGAASRLVDASAGARGVDFETRWAREVDLAADLARDGKAAGGAHDLASFVTVLAGELGGETGRRLQELAVEIHSAFLRCVNESGDPVRAPGAGSHSWLARVRSTLRPPERESAPEAAPDLTTMVDAEIGNPIRELLMRRAQAHAAIADLSLALGDLERKTV